MRTLAEPGTAASWSAPVPWQVEAARRETQDVVTLELAPPESAQPFAFRPGQFNMLYAPGVGEIPVSICGDPAGHGTVLHTIRSVGAVTRALCGARPGEQVGVRGPFGTSWPVSQAEGGDLMIIAGGIGLPPLRPALYEALASRDRFGRIALLYGARTPRDLLFTRELAVWRGRFDLDVEVTVDAATPGWRGDVGVVPDLIRLSRCDPSTTTVFIVGPEIMMRFAVRALLAAGIGAERVFVSMERNMQCAVGMCGHCQLGPFLVCRDGPVLRYADAAPWLRVREV